MTIISKWVGNSNTYPPIMSFFLVRERLLSNLNRASMGLVVRAPGLEPRTSVEGPFSLLKDLSQRCLDDINKGRTATSAQLLLILAGAGE